MTQHRQQNARHQKADEIARAFARFDTTPRRAPLGAIVALVGLSTAAAAFVATGTVPFSRPSGPDVQVALGDAGQTVDGDLLMDQGAPRPGAVLVPVHLPQAEMADAPERVSPPDRVQVRIAQAPDRAPVTEYVPSVDGTPLPTGPRLFAGAPAVVPPARPAALEAVDHAQTLRPRPRPAGIGRALPRDVALATASLMPQPQSILRPRLRPAKATAAPVARQLARGAGCAATLAGDIPRRPAGAAPGRALVDRMAGLHGKPRDALISAELLAGNMPGFLRDLVPVTITGRLPNGRRGDVTICVTPDYLAVGDDDDFIRVPMGLPAAARVADRFGFLLPTTRMVDAIYAQAGLRLPPRPMTPGAEMTSTRYFQQHDRTVSGQTRGRDGQLLTAGQKKDLVLTNRLRRNPGRVAIYGWHKADGQPIQPLSTVHGALYADYSHGVRLVSQTAFVDGRAVALSDLLADPAYARILTEEGPIPAPERLMASLYR